MLTALNDPDAAVRERGIELSEKLFAEGRPPANLAEGGHEGVEVRYARRRGRDAADDRIVELVAADSDPASLCVVTSDRDLVDRVTALGATTEGAGAFLRRLDRLGA